MSQQQKLRISAEDWQWVLRHQGGEEDEKRQKEREWRKEYYRLRKQETQTIEKLRKVQKELKIYSHRPPTLTFSEAQQKRRTALRQYNAAVRSHRPDVLVYQKRLHQAIRQENKTVLYAHRDQLRERLDNLRYRIATLRFV